MGRDDLDVVVRWLRDQGFNVTAVAELATGETELRIVLPR